MKTAEALVAYQLKAAWPETTQDVTSWLQQQPLEKIHGDFQRDGFIMVDRAEPVLSRSSRQYTWNSFRGSRSPITSALVAPISPVYGLASDPSIHTVLSSHTSVTHALPPSCTSWTTSSSQTCWKSTKASTAVSWTARSTRRRTGMISARTQSRSRRTRRTSRRLCGRPTTSRGFSR